ncbi:hybrid sensor histidine kinase/response regulator [Desertifilum sp. FACHB-1129]|uniref:histidine kinase n=2 Tax=Desertifilaceae TaxID=1969992 RepID=A0A1E5QI21_9CYAN|nr:hybrid sensor histidine kinase/response regulator [Desertifilum sp. FACHB-866]MBD2314009.1 hybrid sensor histidine kinase/response regulator [Desertifilum sp. FACHB-1129]MBD2320335.1 hybrid sensor histidine kinase/response regulator [Desertifilum sp. FACHB-866]MBD2330463.1 hybrid sensor histidine kinase/response regulator [Desertifilum sp. FACHB-868]OEJ74227.1 hybrid sensor histidine kinase/response regulator [Desertifilum tharense IPPAS B-1220]
MTHPDLSGFSMLDLFRMEIEAQTAILNENLVVLEERLNASEGAIAPPMSLLELLMRAAHSIKGAARIVQVEQAVQVAHCMEDYFVAAQQQTLQLDSQHIDSLLQGVDLLQRIAQSCSDSPGDAKPLPYQTDIEAFTRAITTLLDQSPDFPLTAPTVSLSAETIPPASPPVLEASPPAQEPEPPPAAAPPKEAKSDRGVRVSRENLNQLMGLAGESLVEANWLFPFIEALQHIKTRQGNLAKAAESLSVHAPTQALSLEQLAPYQVRLEALRQQANECYRLLSESVSNLELYVRRSTNLSDRLYREAIATQMRPFADGVEGLPRLMRDLVKRLGKQVKFEIVGKSTQVDRDILERLEVPIVHLLRNAVDHGIELPQERLAAGKSAEGTIRLEAAHQAGMLWITVSDDGRGIDLADLRDSVTHKGLVSAEMAARLTEAELMEFLFLPGFSTASSVTEISGRGVGLDIVRNIVQEVGGVLRARSQKGAGMTFYLQLPLTLSVVRTLLVEIRQEVYAFSLTRIEQAVRRERSQISRVENRLFFQHEGENIGLVSASQILGYSESSAWAQQPMLSIVVISDTQAVSAAPRNLLQPSQTQRYGVVVDRFLGVKDLVVRPLDPRLGKVQDVSAAALLEDSSLVLILDIEDLVRSIDKFLSEEQLTPADPLEPEMLKPPLKVLVVDDSITVREVERKLLENRGYQVQVAVNGMDAWNAVRTDRFDLVITDVDMPRLNGIELISLMKQSPKLKSLPVIVVSYKDREEDYLKGLDVGANYYLTKSSFQDDTLLRAVIDLIGEP